MDAMATIEDYEARWGMTSLADTTLSTLLMDASLFLAGELQRAGKEVDTTDEIQTASLKRICCRVVHDIIAQQDEIPGVTQATWAATPYSGQYTFSSPPGKMYLYRDEKRELGLLGTKVGSVAPKRWVE